MAYITRDDLINFAKKTPKAGDTLPDDYVNGAMEMVNRYLGYNPEKQTITTKKRGDDGKLLELESMPITEIKSASVNGNDLDVSLFCVNKDNLIEFEDLSLFASDSKYTFTYVAGYEVVPEVIKVTALQLACLLWESAGGNLAVSSTSFADTGSRVFNNFTADRFLKQIENYKMIKF